MEFTREEVEIIYNMFYDMKNMHGLTDFEEEMLDSMHDYLYGEEGEQ